MFPRNILILHAGALGDCVLALDLVRVLKRAWQHSTVTMAARSPIVRWAARHGLLDEGLSLDQIGAAHWYNQESSIPARCLELLRRFDAVISFLGGPEEPITRRLQELSGRDVFAVDPQPTEETLQSRTHIVEQWAAAIRRLEFDLRSEVPSTAAIDDRSREALAGDLRQRIGAQHERIVMVHPGSGGLRKCCPIEAMEQLVAALQLRGRNVGWMIGPDEVERFGPDYARRLEKTALVLCEESVEAAADLVAGADAFIGFDAGMTHVAAIAGVRTVAIFGPTDPRVWGPLGPFCSVVGFPASNGGVEEWVSEVVSCLTARQVD